MGKRKYNPIFCLEEVGLDLQVLYQEAYQATFELSLSDESQMEGQRGLSLFSSCEDDWHLTMSTHSQLSYMVPWTI